MLLYNPTPMKTSKTALKSAAAKPAPKAAKKPAQKPAKKPAKKSAKKAGLTYAAAGVDILAGDKVVDLIGPAVKKTQGPRVMGSLGGFAGCFRLDNHKQFKKNWKKPVLVSCTDGVGTKVLLAIELGLVGSIGQDCVAMNVNDMIVQGAQPLFFLDYIGISKVQPKQTAAIVAGVAKACEIAGCALLGGETAEMPAVYKPGDFDLAGFAVGVAELDDLNQQPQAQEGDIILGLSSSGVHSNGYSLVRAIVKSAKLDLKKKYPELDKKKTLGQVLLEPTRIYVKPVLAAVEKFRKKKAITGMAHITGSGLPGNVCRGLPKHLDAKIYKQAWDLPPVFRFLQEKGGVADAEMFDVFNMGIGYTLFVKPKHAAAVAQMLMDAGEDVHAIGRVVKGRGDVVMVD